VIPVAYTQAWYRGHGWLSLAQCEQDMLITQLMIEIARDDYLGQELAMRGGTCFHKLFLDTPLRYSEDLDYCRTTNTPARKLYDHLRSIADGIGLSCSTQRKTNSIKLFLRTPDTGLKIKVEINTREIDAHPDHCSLPLAVKSSWYTGSASIQTFRLEELMATKIRALFQRRKGRDVFDLWVAITQCEVDWEQSAAVFARYYGIDASLREMADRIEAKKKDSILLADIRNFLAEAPDEYDGLSALDLIRDRLLPKIGVAIE